MTISIIDGDVPALPLAGMFDSAGALLPQSASHYRQFTRPQLQRFGHEYALYSFPTFEAIDHITKLIDGRQAHTIEIGAGNGAWCKALNIVGTDSYQQADSRMAAYYAMHGQPTVNYGLHVERLDAKNALRELKPSVVVAAWVTHKYDARRAELKGNMWGVDEHQLLKRVDEYIFIGNSNVHRDKPIFLDIADNRLPGWDVTCYSLQGPENEERTIFSRASGGLDFIAHVTRV